MLLRDDAARPSGVTGPRDWAALGRDVWLFGEPRTTRRSASCAFEGLILDDILHSATRVAGGARCGGRSRAEVVGLVGDLHGGEGGYGRELTGPLWVRPRGDGTSRAGR